MSIRAMLLSAAAVLLTACAQQPSPPPPVAAPLRAAARRATPAQLPQPRVRHASGAGAARADRAAPAPDAAPDQDAQRNCAYQGLLVEDHDRDEDPSAFGLNSALAGQSARDACLRAYQRSAKPPF